MVPEAKTPKQLKENFLDNNPQYEEIKDSNPSIGDFHAINENDEAWILQCPKGTDISVFKDKKIKLPGRTNQDELEAVAIEYPRPVPHAFGHKNQKGHNSVKIVPIQGSIILRSRLKAIAPPDEFPSETQSGRVPMPSGIKKRHPLHGVDYESKLEISPGIAQRLKHVDEISISSATKRKSKSKNKIREPVSIIVDSDGDVELIAQKKSKKKKKKREHSNDEDASTSDSSKRKKKKNNFIEDVAVLAGLATDLKVVTNCK